MPGLSATALCVPMMISSEGIATRRSSAGGYTFGACWKRRVSRDASRPTPVDERPRVFPGWPVTAAPFAECAQGYGYLSLPSLPA